MMIFVFQRSKSNDLEEEQINEEIRQVNSIVNYIFTIIVGQEILVSKIYHTSLYQYDIQYNIYIHVWIRMAAIAGLYVYSLTLKMFCDFNIRI